jgi:hypothetical protein
MCWKFLFISLQIHIITQILGYKSCLFCQNGGAYKKKEPENKVLRILMPKHLLFIVTQILHITSPNFGAGHQTVILMCM